MNYNYRGIYSSTASYIKQDVVSYQPTVSDPVKYYFCLTDHTSASPQTPNVSADTTYWGIINVLSNFPNTVDTFLDRVNISASDTTDVTRYQVLMLQSSRTSAEDIELNNLVVKLRNKLIYPSDWNSLQQSISNLQSFFKSNVEGFIATKQSDMQSYVDTKKSELTTAQTTSINTMDTKKTEFTTYVDTKESELTTAQTNSINTMDSKKNEFTSFVNTKTNEFDVTLSKFSFQGNYSGTVQYYKWNTVKYNNEAYLCVVDSLGNNPTNTTYWSKIASKGDTGSQGLAGLGLVYQGTYNGTLAYNVQDAVNYGGSIMYCKQAAPIGVNPSDSAYWMLFMSKQNVPISSTPPATPSTNDMWLDISSSNPIMKYFDGTSWIGLNAVNADKLGGQLPSYYETPVGAQAKVDTAVALKVDKVTGKQLSTEDYSTAEKTKLAGVEAGATNYVHPANHPASIITQDVNNRFVTDTEKSTWNGKQNALGFTPENVANKGLANGYASLDAGSKVPASQLPPLGKTAATLIVAASNSKDTSRADYICTGTNDHTTINTAITALGTTGGKVVLLEGLFSIAAAISIPSNVSLEGQGNSTVLQIPNANNTTFNVIQNADATNGNTGITVSNLKIDGNKANNTAGTQNGISFAKVTYSTLQNINAINLRSIGLFFSTSSNNNMINGNAIQGCGVHGIQIQGGSNTICNNICESNTQYGINLNGTSALSNVVTGNCIINPIAINGGASYNTFSGNTISGSMEIAGPNNTFSGNTLKGTNSSGIVVTGNYNTLTNNTIQGYGHGINVAAQYNTISSNTIQKCQQHGIYLSGSSASNNTIIGNTILEVSQVTHNTWSGIFLASGVVSCNIQGNTCRQGAVTNKPQYGIDISNATATGNLVTNNDLTSSGATGALHDVGTGTITTAGNKLA